MARLNIEQEWWTDPRRDALALILGSEELADGVAIKFWKLSQEFWVHKRLIPYARFMRMSYAQEFINAGLAYKKKDMIYVAGTIERHAWLAKYSDNGKKGAEKRISNLRLKSLKNSSSEASSIAQASSSSSSSKEKNKYISEGVKFCLEEYSRTLAHFKILSLPASSEIQIARLGTRYGFEELKLAIVGMRRERKTENFNPADHVSFDRLSKHFEKFRNLGARHVAKQQYPVEPGSGPNGKNDPRNDEPARGDHGSKVTDILEVLKRPQAK